MSKELTKGLDMNYYDKIIPKYNMNNEKLYCVKKDNKWGYISAEGEIIVPIKYVEYSDAYDEWRDLGFTSKPVSKTKMQIIREGFEKATDLLEKTGKIKSIKDDNDKCVVTSCFIKLDNGHMGIAKSVINYDRENIVIIDQATGKVVKRIANECIDGIAKIDSDDEHLYVSYYNTDTPRIMCYKAGTFEKVWEKRMDFASWNGTRSMAVNDNYLIACIRTKEDTSNIYFFNKETGEIDESKTIKNTDTIKLDSYANDIFFHNQFGIMQKGIYELNSAISVTTGRELSIKKDKYDNYDLNGFTIDRNSGKIYIALDDIVGVIGNNGYEGFFLARTRYIQQIKFDQNTGCILLSLQNDGGQIDVYSPEAIETLIHLSTRLNPGSQEDQKKLG